MKAAPANAKPAAIYAGVGLVFLLAGASSGSLVAEGLCSYAALPCLAIAVAYLLRRPQIFMKRSDGRLAPASYVLFGAFHVSNRLFLRLYRRLVRTPQWHEIVPGLYLGECLRGVDRPHWRSSLFHVLDLTAELAEARWTRTGAGYLCLPLLDRTAPRPDQLQQGIGFIRDGLSRGCVYVHCAYGHSRSALFVAAYLLASGRSKTLQEAVALVQAKRPGAYLNRRQWAVLRGA